MQIIHEIIMEIPNREKKNTREQQKVREKIGLFYLSTCYASTVPLEEKEPIEVEECRG